jgi:hypothetical protein
MISKSTFKELSLAQNDGNYFLRPDRILGAFRIDSSALPMVVSIEAVSEMIVEKNRELKVYELLQLADSKQKSNSDRIDRAISLIWAVDEVKAMMEKNMKDLSTNMSDDMPDVSTANVQSSNQNTGGGALLGSIMRYSMKTANNSNNFRSALPQPSSPPIQNGGDIEMNVMMNPIKRRVGDAEEEDNQMISNQIVRVHEVNSFETEKDSMIEEEITEVPTII